MIIIVIFTRQPQCAIHKSIVYNDGAKILPATNLEIQFKDRPEDCQLIIHGLVTLGIIYFRYEHKYNK